jgi:two-component system, cell cycle response regulator DivK
MSNELILIIEDDANTRMLLRDLLVVTGYRTMESQTAEEGIQLAQQHRPALVLMDIHLPGMNGIEALRRLRRGTGTGAIPVIAVTASVMDDQRQAAMDAGFDAFERKPISITGLLQTVRSVIDRSKEPPARP